MDNKNVLLALSGGVDSSVAAFLIKQQGYNAIGATMKLYQNKFIDENNACCTEQDIEDARNICKTLDIPFYVYNFSDNFEQEVISRFIDAYEKGLTPNPCIDCNRYIKFTRLMKQMFELNMDYVVTGHYAQIEYNPKTERYELKKALDKSKDQSYVLYSLTQKQLSHTLLPLGKLSKEQVRKIAEENNFVNSHKKDSQDICFVPNGKYAEFIEAYQNKKYPVGNFIDTKGNILGKHKGIIRYTVGQRKGLGLALPEPMYVKEKNIENNNVILCTNNELFTKELYANNINLISVSEIKTPLKIKAKIRYNQQEQPATVTQENNRLHIIFDEPQRAIAKGQAVVLYDDDIVVGGGTIE